MGLEFCLYFWQIIMRCHKPTFSSSFLTVLRLALKSTDSLTLEPRRAPNMASAEIFTLLRAGLFILPLSSVIFIFKSVTWTDSWMSTKTHKCIYWWFFCLWMIEGEHTSFAFLVTLAEISYLSSSTTSIFWWSSLQRA